MKTLEDSQREMQERNARKKPGKGLAVPEAARSRHAAACSAWKPSSQPAWLTSEVFSHKVQPLLAGVSTSAIRTRIGVSRWYASRIRQGYRPHPRHWVGLVGGSPDM